MSSSAESPLIRRTRWRLIAWSGGSTLVVLVVLGVAIYAATASSLRNAGISQLQDRVTNLAVNKLQTVTAPPIGIPVTQDPTSTGVLIGGESSGTIAMVVPLDVLENAAERGRQQISFNGGVGGTTGSSFGMEYSTNNLLGRGETLSFNVAAGNRRIQSSVRLTF